MAILTEQSLSQFGYTSDQIQEIMEGQNENLDVSFYTNPSFLSIQMYQIRLGLEEGLSVEYYANPLYSYWQMQEIRLGLEDNLNVDDYSSFMYTAKEMKKRRLQQLEQSNSLSSNSNWNVEALSAFYISISPNEMEAYIEITDETDTVSTDSILHALHYAGICHGINKSIINQIANNPVSGRKYRIAAGTAPAQGRDGWYEYLFRTNPDYAPTQLPDGAVDFQNINWFETVEKDQTIAIYHPAEEGISGCTVTGRTLPAKHGTEQHILTGTGFQLLADQHTYTAAITGRIQLDKEILTITNLLQLKDISTTTGKIDFDGDISITGNVGNGAIIHATGDIIINGYVEAALIKCGGNILFRQGINGSGGGQITAKGNIMGKFFEAANVSAEGNIEIMYSLNSNLFAMYGNRWKMYNNKSQVKFYLCFPSA